MTVPNPLEFPCILPAWKAHAAFDRANVAKANNSRYTGDVFQQEPKGSAFWWRSQLASILLRPRAVVDAALQLLKASLNLRGGVISVHVRHGDACMHASISRFRPQCVPWGELGAKAKCAGASRGGCAARLFAWMLVCFPRLAPLRPGCLELCCPRLT